MNSGSGRDHRQANSPSTCRRSTHGVRCSAYEVACHLKDRVACARADAAIATDSRLGLTCVVKDALDHDRDVPLVPAILAVVAVDHQVALDDHCTELGVVAGAFEVYALADRSASTS